MTDHPHQNIWDAIAARLGNDPLPAGPWRLIEGEHRLIGAVLHAQTEPCPTCQVGPIRETVGLVCQTCGRDYGRELGR